MSREHKVEVLFTHKSAWGTVVGLQASPDGRRVAYRADRPDDEGRATIQIVVWDGRVMAEYRSETEELIGHLSPDGRHLAIIRRRGCFNTIEIDGQPAFQTALDVIHYNGWLDNERFAWEGWIDGEHGEIDGPSRYFVNGEETTGRLEVQGIVDTRGRYGLQVTEDGFLYTVWQDGERTEKVKIVEGDIWQYSRTLGYANDPKYAHLHPSWNRTADERGCSVTHRGVTSPTAFEASGGRPEFAVNADGTLIGYIGIRYADWAAPISALGQRLFERAERHQRRTGKEPFWALPFAFLYSPYTPFLYPLMEGSRRHFPVKASYSPDGDGWKLEEHIWKKGYRCVSDEMLTPAGELVVVAHERNHCCVVVDEVEGPAFDQIWNVRHDADGDRLIYIARRGGEICRVEAIPLR